MNVFSVIESLQIAFLRKIPANRFFCPIVNSLPPARVKLFRFKPILKNHFPLFEKIESC